MVIVFPVRLCRRVEDGAAGRRRMKAGLPPVQNSAVALAFVQPNATLVVLIAAFAAYAIFDGVLAISAGVSMDGGPRWMLILGGILGIAVGLLTINRPDVTALALVLLIGVWAIATGIAEAVAPSCRSAGT
jgi:uncharacterized membrane protein HdeD (DUF308 family)